jgi:hypothetical protein
VQYSSIYIISYDNNAFASLAAAPIVGLHSVSISIRFFLDSFEALSPYGLSLCPNQLFYWSTALPHIRGDFAFQSVALLFWFAGFAPRELHHIKDLGLRM